MKSNYFLWKYAVTAPRRILRTRQVAQEECKVSIEECRKRSQMTTDSLSQKPYTYFIITLVFLRVKIGKRRGIRIFWNSPWNFLAIRFTKSWMNFSRLYDCWQLIAAGRKPRLEKSRCRVRSCPLPATHPKRGTRTGTHITQVLGSGAYHNARTLIGPREWFHTVPSKPSHTTFNCAPLRSSSFGGLHYFVSARSARIVRFPTYRRATSSESWSRSGARRREGEWNRGIKFWEKPWMKKPAAGITKWKRWLIRISHTENFLSLAWIVRNFWTPIKVSSG